MAIAYVTGVDSVRCNVVIGSYVTDQDHQGCAAELARLRAGFDRDVLVLERRPVKQAYPLFNVPEDAARDLAEAASTR